MELQHLRYFYEVANHLNFTKAANALNITQPPLTRRIQKLEEGLGVQLFRRTNRTVELTEAGAYLYEVSKRMLKKLEEDVAAVKLIASGKQGILNVGFSGSVVFDLLPNIIKEVHYQYPDLKLNVRQLTTRQQVSSLLCGIIDVGILVPPVNVRNIKTLVIRREQFIACLPKHHPLVKSANLYIEDFKNDDIIMPPRAAGEGYYLSLMSLYAMGKFTPNIVQTAEEQQTIVSLVAANIGVAFVPESTQSIHNKGVIYRYLNKSLLKETAIAWNQDYDFPTVRIFIELVKKNFISP